MFIQLQDLLASQWSAALLAIQLIEWVAHFAGEALCLPVPGDHEDNGDDNVNN